MGIWGSQIIYTWLSCFCVQIITMCNEFCGECLTVTDPFCCWMKNWKTVLTWKGDIHDELINCNLDNAKSEYNPVFYVMVTHSTENFVKMYISSWRWLLQTCIINEVWNVKICLLNSWVCTSESFPAVKDTTNRLLSERHTILLHLVC
jgi:hypothetical protein